MNKNINKKKIFSTKPLLPPLVELIPYLERIWESGIITNCGYEHQEFEKELCNYLDVKYISLFSSGTMALTIALKALDLKGEVITTPFTHVATAQAIYWNNLKPVFVDINESDLNIDISKIESAITPDTCAILPVHIFGNPCNIHEISKISQKHHLKVIYDAAHCFGMTIRGESICNFGDLTVLSFHATKVFNSIEGGAIVCHNESMKKYIDALKNTGLNKNQQLIGYGLNAKMNEVQSAYGRVLLKHVSQAIEKRNFATKRYMELLRNIQGISFIDEQIEVKYNYSYFPILIEPTEFGVSRDEIIKYFESKNIFLKKYFCPLVSDYNEFKKYTTDNLPVAEEISKNIVCLPLSHEIQPFEIELVVCYLIEIQKKGMELSNIYIDRIFS
jgi:dTDP-4-amino-4,6-dideoxygalactose transaminase